MKKESFPRRLLHVLESVKARARLTSELGETWYIFGAAIYSSNVFFILNIEELINDYNIITGSELAAFTYRILNSFFYVSCSTLDIISTHS